MPVNRENCWGISWSCGMCAVIHAHAEEIFLPRACEGTGQEENRSMRKWSCSPSAGVALGQISLVSLCACWLHVSLSDRLDPAYTACSLSSALENPFAVGTRTLEVQVSCCHGAPTRGSQKSSLEFRRSPSCAVSYDSSRKVFHMMEEKILV